MADQAPSPSRTPAYSLSVDGRTITSTVAPRLVSLTLTDNRGFEADTLELTLDDSDGALELPRKGASVRVALGWADTGTVDKGTYVVDELEHSGSPDTLTLRARSADLRASLTEKREQSWHSTTVAGIVNAMAQRHGLQPAVGADLAGNVVDHIDQTNESDVNLLTRLAQQHGATATVKDGRLLFIATGMGRTASGKPLPAASITRQDGDQHRFAVADREAYTAVRAVYFDVKHATRGEVLVNAEKAAQLRAQTMAAERKANDTINSTNPTYTIEHTYASKAHAIAGAKKMLAKVQQPQVKARYADVRRKTSGEVLATKRGVKVLPASKVKDASGPPADLPAAPDTIAPAASDTGNIKTLRHTYATKENALRAARAAWERLQRGMATFTLVLAHGRPELMPEQPMQVQGFKPQIDAMGWTVTRATHSLNDNGYTTTVELEMRVDELPDMSDSATP